MMRRGRSRTRTATVASLALVAATAVQVGMPHAGFAEMPMEPASAKSAAAVTTEQAGAPRVTSTDTLWVVDGWNPELGLGVCTSPTSTLALGSCFAPGGTTVLDPPVLGMPNVLTTDGTNVYILLMAGAYSCPIADLGANCTHIMAGSWPTPTNDEWVQGLAAADGSIWIGQGNGVIYQCPNDLPYSNSNTAPSECSTFDTLSEGVTSMVLANGTLYVGTQAGSQGGVDGVVACDPQAANSCVQLDWPDSPVAALTVGAGYLWAGLGNGTVWRCAPTTPNACSTWYQASSAVSGLAYDGAGILYVEVPWTSKRNVGGALSCSTSQQDGCSTYMANSNPSGMGGLGAGAVVAADGQVFVGNGTGLYSGTAPYAKATSGWDQASMLYIPAGGPTGVGAVLTRSLRGPWLRKLDRQCQVAGGARNARLTFKVSGPRGLVRKVAVPLRGQGSSRVLRATFDLLEPGLYDVVAQGRGNCGGKQFTKKITRAAVVKKDRTTKIEVKYARH